jgi:CheY-like chemotaxis protein
MSNEVPVFLLIDSDERFLLFLQNLIQSLGCDCQCASNAEEALNLIEQFNIGKKFDAIFTDINLPNLSGLELIKILNSSPDTLSIPKVIISSLDKYNDILRGYSCGTDYYMTKPIDNDQLVYALDVIFQNNNAQQDRYHLQEA